MLASGDVSNPPGAYLQGYIAHSNVASNEPPRTFSVQVKVTKQADPSQSGTTSFSWTISDTNRIRWPAYELYNWEGDHVSQSVIVRPDYQGRLTYRAAGLPRGLTIEPNTGVIHGQITYNNAQPEPGYTDFAITIYAEDGETQDERSFVWRVWNFVGIRAPEQLMHEGAENVSILLDYVDLPSVVSFSAVGLPRGLNIDSETGLIWGTLSYGNVPTGQGYRVYSVTVSARNEELEYSASFEWFIVDVNRLVRPSWQYNYEGDRVTLPTANGTYAQVTYSASGLPPGLTIDRRTGIISGEIPQDVVGAGQNVVHYWVTITLTDSESSDQRTLVWSMVRDELRIIILESDFNTEIHYIRDDEGKVRWSDKDTLHIVGKGPIGYPIIVRLWIGTSGENQELIVHAESALAFLDEPGRLVREFDVYVDPGYWMHGCAIQLTLVPGTIPLPQATVGIAIYQVGGGIVPLHSLLVSPALVSHHAGDARDLFLLTLQNNDEQAYRVLVKAAEEFPGGIRSFEVYHVYLQSLREEFKYFAGIDVDAVENLILVHVELHRNASEGNITRAQLAYLRQWAKQNGFNRNPNELYDWIKDLYAPIKGYLKQGKTLNEAIKLAYRAETLTSDAAEKIKKLSEFMKDFARKSRELVDHPQLRSFMLRVNADWRRAQQFVSATCQRLRNAITRAKMGMRVGSVMFKGLEYATLCAGALAAFEVAVNPALQQDLWDKTVDFCGHTFNASRSTLITAPCRQIPTMPSNRNFELGELRCKTLICSKIPFSRDCKH